MNLPSGIAIRPTSAGGAMIQFPTGNRVLVGVLAAGLSTSAGYALAAELPCPPSYAIHQSTTSGTVLVPEGGAGAAIGELRRLSGFTWDQLARLFGVSRRSLHFWASGKAMTPANEEHLHRVLATIRKIDRGTAAANRAALLSSKDGEFPLDLLAEGQYDRVVVVVGAGGAPKRPALKPLSQAARDARRPPPPEELVNALQDSVHREFGRPRAARSVKVRGAG